MPTLQPIDVAIIQILYDFLYIVVGDHYYKFSISCQLCWLVGRKVWLWNSRQLNIGLIEAKIYKPTLEKIQILCKLFGSTKDGLRVVPIQLETTLLMTKWHGEYINPKGPLSVWWTNGILGRYLQSEFISWFSEIFFEDRKIE